MSKDRNIANLQLDGGLLCLDFVNTVQTRKRSTSHEYLADYPTFLHWCLKVGIITSAEANQLEELAKRSLENEVAAFKEIIAAREMLYRLFSQKAEAGVIDEDTLGQFNALLGEAMKHLGFENGSHGPIQTWQDKERELTSPLWPLIRSAYEILTAPEAKHVKECTSCGWLFLDKSRAHTRRWCNPLECGSVDKATRYYHKMKAKKKG